MRNLVLSTPKRSVRSARQQHVLTELIDLFLAEGFRDLNLAEVATRLRCSKTTLYGIAPSREQLIKVVVAEFFRRATEHVEARIGSGSTNRSRVADYLMAISMELALGSPAFFADVSDFEPAREIYARNTTFAATRVKELVLETGVRGGVDPTLLGVFAGQLMEAINLGRTAEVTGLDDAAAYRALADLIAAGAPDGD